VDIAVIGWGSLIWCPGCLRLRSRWHLDGPRLPIEFARISRDGRLTLVIHDGSEEQKTLWALSEFEDLAEARANLKEREGCADSRVHSLIRGKMETVSVGIQAKIRAWLEGMPDIEAAVWTALSDNWRDKRSRDFTPDDAVAYLGELERSAQEAAQKLARAREYIRNAPSQIQTEVRRRMSSNANWKDNELSKTLFEDPPDR